MKNPSLEGVNRKDIKNAIKAWLRNASDRNGGRRGREKKIETLPM